MPNEKDVLNIELNVSGNIQVRAGSELAEKFHDAFENNRCLCNLFSEFNLPSAYSFVVTNLHYSAVGEDVYTTFTFELVNT